MQEYILGQRWISDTESDMGLGTVMAVEPRSVTIVFLASGETRTYSKQTAPLRRVSFGIGDSISSHEGWTLKVEAVKEEAGLFRYFGRREDGSEGELAEEHLDNFIQLNRSSDRLFNGKVDSENWFELRYLTLFHINRLAHSPLRGIIGGRTSLIPHQLYIAHEVANRYAPRVLLADEVGLGKTIEAGMILHQQILTERARRVLVVVPETLVHQWFVEMLRRFNLHFHIFDEERCASLQVQLDEDGEDEQELHETDNENPFYSEQFILCSLEFLAAQPQRFAQALQGEWDILVVDEAHHLQWSEEDPSMEYRMIEQLAAVTKGVLLLTATPEQLGKASHFARLRLLDPNRFPDFQSFVAEESSYEPIAEAIENLMSEQELSEPARRVLYSTLEEGDNQVNLEIVKNSNYSAEENQKARHELIEHLLDRHGTGRVLFRNTRKSIKGFPNRKLVVYELPLADQYAQCFERVQNMGVSEMQFLLSPEHLYQNEEEAKPGQWVSFDSRVTWLLQKLEELAQEKVLLITAYASTALQLAAFLKRKTGRSAAVFHEGLSIVERDRAAAYFADKESGAQVLICSEIGSEGRNFQFAHHLILFDLPFNPDLLEQRIGRLDRIGQDSDIQIHLPILENSPQSIMFAWYHQGLDAFESICPSAHNIFVQLRPLLTEALHQLDEGLQDLSALIETTQKLRHDLNVQMSRGRDKLLEYNSCRPVLANELCRLAQACDQDISPLSYMEKVYECFGVDYDELSNQRYYVRPSSHMVIQNFPGLREEGMAISYQRDVSLANEDVHFISWDHPLVLGAMDLVISQEQGNTALTAIKYAGAKAGSLLLECIYLIEPAPNPLLQSSRYLPPTLIRVVCDQKGCDHCNLLSHEDIIPQQSLDPNTINKIIKSKNHAIRAMINRCEEMANMQAPEILKNAHENADSALDGEISRLKALMSINANVRREELEYFERQKHALNEAIESVNLKLDALRVLVVVP